MGCSHNCDSCSSNCGGEKSLKVAANPAASVKKVIGVVSGKGGVGKSLLTSMMAVGMTRKGYSCGVLDADITGPSIPKTFGVHGQLLTYISCVPVSAGGRHHRCHLAAGSGLHDRRQGG